MTTQDTTPVGEAAPAARCPVLHEAPAAMGSLANQHWWPEQLNLRPLNKNSPLIDPMGDSFDYAEEFNSLDLAAVKADIEDVLTTSQGLVAGRLRPLRAADDPHGVAQRRHLPHP